MNRIVKIKKLQDLMEQIVKIQVEKYVMFIHQLKKVHYKEARPGILVPIAKREKDTKGTCYIIIKLSQRSMC